MWYLSPGAEMIGYHTGGILLFASAVLIYAMVKRDHTRPIASSLICGALVAVAPLIGSMKASIPHPLEFLSGFLTGCAVFWIGYLATAKMRSRWFRLPVAIFAFLVATQAGGYVKAVGYTINHAHDDFVSGFVEARKPFGDGEFFRSLFNAHPALVTEIMTIHYDPAQGQNASATIQKRISDQVVSDLKHAPNDQVLAVFRAGNGMLSHVAEKNYRNCVRLINGEVTDSELRTIVEGRVWEESLGAWAKLFVTVADNPELPEKDATSWEALAEQMTPTEEISRVMNLADDNERDCRVELLFRKESEKLPLEDAATIARGFLISQTALAERSARP